MIMGKMKDSKWIRHSVALAFFLSMLSGFYCKSLMMDSFYGFQMCLYKLALSVGNQAFSRLLLKSGCSGGLTLAIGFVVRMAFLAIEGTPSVGNNMMPPAGGEGGSGEQESSWSGSWIERWLYPEGTSSDPNQGPPTVAQDQEEHLPQLVLCPWYFLGVEESG